jgi:hypothetical protein
MKYFLLILLFTITACSSTNSLIDQNIVRNVPEGASKIIISSSLPVDSLYLKTINTLSVDGYSFIYTYDKTHEITTKDKYIDSRDLPSTYMGLKFMINVTVRNNRKGSKAILRGRWANSYYYGIPAKWDDGYSQINKYAFTYLIQEAKHLKGQITYK